MSRFFALLAAGVLSACASSGATPRPFPSPHPAPARPAAPSAPGAPVSVPNVASGYAVAGTALALRGSPYRNGGADPTGFDCSGFVRYVFGQHGLAVPRNVGELFRAGEQIPADALQPGDLVFFNTVGGGASHVGIAIGGDEFVHAPSTSGAVRVDRIGGSYWASRFLGARRLN
jgi:cell wall-associated NlpC family hydrolase